MCGLWPIHGDPGTWLDRDAIFSCLESRYLYRRMGHSGWDLKFTRGSQALRELLWHPLLSWEIRELALQQGVVWDLTGRGHVDIHNWFLFREIIPQSCSALTQYRILQVNDRHKWNKFAEQSYLHIFPYQPMYPPCTRCVWSKPERSLVCDLIDSEHAVPGSEQNGKNT